MILRFAEGLETPIWIAFPVMYCLYYGKMLVWYLLMHDRWSQILKLAPHSVSVSTVNPQHITYHVLVIVVSSVVVDVTLVYLWLLTQREIRFRHWGIHWGPQKWFYLRVEWYHHEACYHTEYSTHSYTHDTRMIQTTNPPPLDFNVRLQSCTYAFSTTSWFRFEQVIHFRNARIFKTQVTE